MEPRTRWKPRRARHVRRAPHAVHVLPQRLALLAKGVTPALALGDRHLGHAEPRIAEKLRTLAIRWDTGHPTTVLLRCITSGGCQRINEGATV